MILDRIQAQGLLRFVDPIDISLKDLGPGLVAFVGNNGSGKTSTLEMLPAALYGELPSREKGALYDRCNRRDAFIELGFDNGQENVDLRVVLDMSARKSEYYIAIDGEQASNGKEKPYRKLVDSMFGSSDLLLASVFASQNRRGNILELTRAERKQLFAELLGLDHLQVLAERAGERVKVADRALIDLRGERRAYTDKADELSSAQRVVLDAREQLDGANEDALAAKEAVDSLQTQLAADAERVAKRATLQAELEAAEAELRTIETRRTHAAATLTAAEAAVDRQLDALGVDPIDRLRREAQARYERQAAELKGREELDKPLIDQAKVIRAAAEGLPGEREQLARREGIEADYKSQKKRLDSLTQRAELIGQVPCSVTDRWGDDNEQDPDLVDLAGTCPLLANAQNARAEASELSLAVAVLESEREGRLKEIDILKTVIAQLADDAAMLSALEGAEQRQKRQQADMKALKDLLARDRKDAELNSAAWAGKVAVAVDERKAARAAADAAHEATAKPLETAQSKVHSISKTIYGLGHSDNAVTSAQVENARTEVERRSSTLAFATQALAKAEADEQACLEAKSKSDELLTKIGATEHDLKVWRTLQDALGPKGIQALMIDAAGPKIATIANELLEATWDGRFSIEFETLQEKKRGGGYKEVFEINVYDTGKPRAAGDLSGGEKAVLSEAVAIAVGIFNAKQSGIQWRQLFRDETAGALDPEAAQNYVAMLRRARELGGFHQIIFVAHQPDVWGAADSKVYFDNGRVSTSEVAPCPVAV